MEGVSPVSIVVIDDDPLVRAGLSLILGGSEEHQVVAEAPDGQTGVEVVRRVRPDVALMDIRMPKMNGIEATRQITAAGLPTRVLVLTTFDADEMVVDALRAGAAGYLMKDTPPEKLVEAIHAAAAGQPALSPSVMTQLIAAVTGDARRASAAAQLSRLTDKELEVARAIAQGLSNAEIAEQSHMSLSTVKTHISHAMEKLGAENRVQVAIVIHEAG
jgi:DNA-binding NarL/FixJ family response regulator